jgi:hypothetical protein
MLSSWAEEADRILQILDPPLDRSAQPQAARVRKRFCWPGKGVARINARRPIQRVGAGILAAGSDSGRKR